MNKENQDYLNREFDKFKNANANCLKIKITGWKDGTLFDSIDDSLFYSLIASSAYLTISKEQLEQIKEILINSN